MAAVVGLKLAIERLQLIRRSWPMSGLRLIAWPHSRPRIYRGELEPRRVPVVFKESQKLRAGLGALSRWGQMPTIVLSSGISFGRNSGAQLSGPNN